MPKFGELLTRNNLQEITTTSKLLYDLAQGNINI